MSVPPNPPSQPGGPYPGQQPYQQQPQHELPKKKRKKWPWILLAIFVVIIGGFAACTAVVGKAVNDVTEDSKTVVDVTYKVVGPAQGALITYTVNDNITQDSGVTLPWEKATQVSGFAKTANLSATNGIDDAGKITCQVIVGGKVIIENTATGPGASASCAGSVDKK